VLKLRQQGFENAAALLGGLQAWKDAGYEVEAQPMP
jgi:rhodanese-related sulfurtransferase